MEVPPLCVIHGIDFQRVAIGGPRSADETDPDAFQHAGETILYPSMIC